MLTLTYDGRGYVNATAGQLLGLGVPQSAIDAALAAERVADIKAECKRRIYAEASTETQMNMNAVATAINSKAAGARTAEENGILTAHASAVGWVKAMRDACAVLAADPDSEWRADDAWPEPPADAKAFAASV